MEDGKTTLTIKDKQYLVGLLGGYKVIKPTANDERMVKSILNKLKEELNNS